MGERGFMPRHPFLVNQIMKRFISRSELYIPILINGHWITVHFEDMQWGYSYVPKNEDECNELLSHPFCKSGEMWVVEEVEEEVKVQKQPTAIESLAKLNKLCRNKSEADAKKKEIVDGVSCCSDARAYLRERFGDENVTLRSKKEILEYADAHNIFFSGLL